MYISPNTTIVLCANVPLTNDNKNTILFGSQNEQLGYFNNKSVGSATQVSYTRHTNNYIDLNFSFSNSKNVNYLYFKNESHENKYYFCYVTNFEYINENCTRFYFEVDYMQTFLFDITYKPCFVEREHVNSDVIGEHTIYEDVETGVMQLCYQVNHMINSVLVPIMVLTDVLPTGQDVVNYGSHSNGIFNGLNFFAINPYEDQGSINIYYIQDYLKALKQANKLDSIVSIYVYPLALLQGVSFNGNGYVKINDAGSVGYSVSRATLRNTMFQNYFTPSSRYYPKNNKLYNKQFNTLIVENGNGGAVEYDMNKFVGEGSVAFVIFGTLTPSADTRLIPYNYCLSEINNEYGLNGGGYPQCAWVSDYYSSWLMANGSQWSTSIGNAVAQTLINPASLLTGNLVSTINNAMAKKTDAQNISDSAKGKQSNYINCITGFSDFNLIVKSIDYNHAKTIDDFFTMFGYKINEVKTPNISGRNSWNYVKTIDCTFSVNGNNVAQETIRKIFDDGVFLWHTYDVGNFGLNNNIV